jgi:HEAT repeat protein
VRGAAADGLIAIGAPSLDRVAKIYGDRKAPMFTRTRAAAVLGALGDPAVEPITRVIERANDDSEFDNVTIDTTALSAGVDALSRIGTPASDKALARLVEEEHPYVYEQALTALASKESDERMRLMLRFMKRCIDPYHCQPIGEALAKYGAKVQPDLIKQLKSGSWEEDGPRTAAANALGRIGTDEAVDALVSVLRRESDNDLRDVYDAVAESLARCTNPRARSFVSERVTKRDYRFIAGAYGTLKERIGSDLILKALEEEGGFSMASGLINDADPALRNGARQWAEDNGHRVEEWKPGRTITP